MLTDGPCFYEGELAAIASARSTINLEAYIFQKGEMAERYVRRPHGTRPRRRRGARDARLYRQLEHAPAAICKGYSMPVANSAGITRCESSSFRELNNRTHRELLVVDGSTAFVGGAGVADWWMNDGVKGKRWRDMMVRVEGPSAAALQAVFAQNWLRVSGEILTGPGLFLNDDDGQGAPALVVGSTPAAGATQSRILFQLLIASARKCIYISTPYFLPSRSARQAIIQAARDRHVEVKVITPGDNNDQPITRASSRNLYGSLLKHGIKIYEYLPVDESHQGSDGGRCLGRRRLH